jgi:hypothetical protein
MDNTQIGLAGEFYVLAQLVQRGLVASLTLANTKGVDILVANATLHQRFKIEVKTTNSPPRRESLFAQEPCYAWPMRAQHECVMDANLFYCFVALRGCKHLPKFFIVPSLYVATYVREQHAYWLRTRQKPVADTAMRRFRIPASDPLGFEGNWAVLAGEAVQEKHLTLAEPWCGLEYGASPGPRSGVAPRETISVPGPQRR